MYGRGQLCIIIYASEEIWILYKNNGGILVNKLYQCLRASAKVARCSGLKACSVSGRSGYGGVKITVLP